MLDQATHQKIADELHEAGRTGTPVPLITARYEGMEVEDSYAIQRIWAQRQVEAGRRVAGHKIGLTSKAMQAATGITEPDYGVIFDDQVVESGHEFETARITNPRIEMELAFVLKEELRGPGVTLFDVLRATEYVVPALEVLDAHVELQGRTIVDTIADNAALGYMVLGGRPVAPDAVDLRWVAGTLSRNQTIEETGVAAGVLNHPGNGVHWLANRLADHGDSLAAGEVVLAGSFTRPMHVSAGDTVTADYGPLGTVTCRFA